MSTRKKDPILSAMNSMLVDLPAPSNISLAWNMGSILGLTLGIQVVTGLILASQYSNTAEVSFMSVVHILQDVNWGWGVRVVHANGASLFFVCLYLHVGRGVYYGSYRLFHTWMVGVTILLAVMATAFLGYVLPWGQMSFWGATVITNLLSTIPYVGGDLVQWMWGGFAVNNATLTRFFTFHFTLPFVLVGMVGLHIVFLHQTGSNNPLGLNSAPDKIPFHPYFIFKDSMGFMVVLFLFTMLCLYSPYLLGDPENFNPANPLNTPLHIQPEWYYLFAYAILRSIPNKLGGVMALALSIMVLYILPLTQVKPMRSCQFYPVNQILFWSFVSVVLMLTWIGGRPVEDPYIMVGQILTVVYFGYFVADPMVSLWWFNLTERKL